MYLYSVSMIYMQRAIMYKCMHACICACMHACMHARIFIIRNDNLIGTGARGHNYPSVEGAQLPKCPSARRLSWVAGSPERAERSGPLAQVYS
jgi:hypothetical protein